MRDQDHHLIRIKKDSFYKDIDWLVDQGSLSEDMLENIDKGKELKLNFYKISI